MDGQNVNIALTSGLEVASNDMLVNANAPKFLHNRQKMQGRYMPSSVRFEHDGWAIDKQVWEFLLTEGVVKTTPEKYFITKRCINSLVPIYRYYIKDKNKNTVATFEFTSEDEKFENGKLRLELSSTIGVDIEVIDGVWTVVNVEKVNEAEVVDLELTATGPGETHQYEIEVINKAKTEDGTELRFIKGESFVVDSATLQLLKKTEDATYYANSQIEIKISGNDITSFVYLDSGKNVLSPTASTGKFGVMDSAVILPVFTEKSFITSITGMSSAEERQYISTQADQNVLAGNDITWKISSEENSSGVWKTCRNNDGVLFYDDDNCRSRVRIDVTVPMWAGLIAHKGIVQRDVSRETPVDATVRMVNLPQGKYASAHPSISIAAGAFSDGEYLHNYAKSVLLPNIDIMEQENNIVSDEGQSKYLIRQIATFGLKITGTYSVIERTGWEEISYSEWYAIYHSNHAFDDDWIYHTREEKKHESENNNHIIYIDKYYRVYFRPVQKSFSVIIDFSKWYNPYETVATFLNNLRQRIVFDTAGGITTGVDYDEEDDTYGYEQEGKVLVDTMSYSLGFMAGSSSFNDSSYLPQEIIPNDNAWLKRICSDMNSLGSRNLSVYRYTLDVAGNIGVVLTNGKTCASFAGAKAFFLMPAIFSSYLTVKKPFAMLLKDKASLEKEDFEIEETTPYATNNKLVLTGENRRFALAIKGFNESTGCTLTVISVTEEPESLYFVKMGGSSTTPKRFWQDNLNGFYPPYKNVTNNSMVKVKVAKGVVGATATGLDVNIDIVEINESKYLDEVSLSCENLDILESFKCNAKEHYAAIKRLGLTKESLITRVLDVKKGKCAVEQKCYISNADEELPFKYEVVFDGKVKQVAVVPSYVLGHSDFDVRYRVDNADLSVVFLYTQYFDKDLPEEYEVYKKEGSGYTKLLALYEDGVLYADTGDRRYGYTFESNELYLQFDLNTGTLKERKVSNSDFYLKKNQNIVDVIISTKESVKATGITLQAVYKENGVTNVHVEQDSLRFTIDGVEYTVDTREFDVPQNKTSLEYFYTDVEDEDCNRVLVGQQSFDNEYQFLKQQWNTTVEVENYWWVDSKHILVLTKSELRLLKKTTEVDDWAGDKWENEKTYRRFDYIDSTVLNYFTTSVKGREAEAQGALLVTVHKGSGNSIQIVMYSPMQDMQKVSFNVKLVHKAIGKELNTRDTKDFNTYSTLIVDNVISQGKWSATAIGDLVVIGLHYNNNYDQWAIVVNRAGKIKTVVQGYGFVGAGGLLTGGEIPKDYLAQYAEQGYIGFNTKVEDIKTLGGSDETAKRYVSSTDLNVITDKVVGTATQQWYIKSKVSDIVSHIKVAISGENIVFTPEYLPITNNYSAVYGSGSFTSAIMGDVTPQFRTLIEFLSNAKNSGWGKFVNILASPTVPFFDAKLSTMVYLQQTLGQAAYVHYNSTSIHQSKDMNEESYLQNNINDGREAAALEQPTAVSRDSIAFDYQSIRQNDSASSGHDIYKNLLLLCGSAMVAAENVAADRLRVNESTNLQVVDLGTPEQLVAAHSKFFAENMAGAAIAEIRGLDMNPSLNSEVTALKNLEMFYSTCDEQRISAGKGWVNHNLQAQCTVQSITSLNMTGRQQRFFWIVKSAATLPARLALAAADKLVKSLESTLGSTDGGLTLGFFAGVANGTTTNAPEVSAHYGVMAGYLAALSFRAQCEATYNVTEAVLEAMGGDHLQSNVTHLNTAHNINPEATHRYGTKTECFMYPCWDCKSNVYTDETVQAGLRDKEWELDMHAFTENGKADYSDCDNVTHRQSEDLKKTLEGTVHYYIAAVRGVTAEKKLPQGMASVIGVNSFLDNDYFKNENIGESEPVFTTPPFQDYIIDEEWQLGRTASVGMTTWISCKDTKLIDGEESNVVITNEFCGVASPYVAIEIKRGFEQKYIRPFAITPKVLGLNHTGYNCVFERKMYHAFDGIGYRLVDWVGEKGMAKGGRAFQYSFLVNDRFKRSNKMPHNTFFGNFKCDPTIALSGTAEDKVFSLVTMPEENKGLTAGTIGEDKDIRRYSLPVFTEYVSTLPAIVKTISSYNLSVIDGITTLTAENHDLQSAYKAPISIDFAIGEQKFRYTEEYICVLQQSKGVTVLQHVVPCIGLTFVGATPNEALFYSKDNKQYYTFGGGQNLRLVDMIERFRNLITGKYDFINREIIVPALATFKRLDDKVEDGYADDEKETDNIVIMRMNGQEISGEIAPPIRTIFTTKEGEDIRRWFRVLSLPMGITYQGPNRCIVNRFVVNDYMLKGIRENYGKWKRVPREQYHPFRKYRKNFETVTESIGDDVVKGWTHNPFLLVTAPLGVSEEVDCMFEWNITFCWTREMDMLYNKDEYAVVNIMAETMTVGGKVVSARPVHVFLIKELFTRTGNYGYYSFRFQSNCGAGNRERLHIWSDQYIAISSLTLVYKQVTGKHNDILTQQVDTQLLKEI